MPDRLSPAVPGGPLPTFAGLLAEEISALRKLAHDRRSVSFALFRGRLATLDDAVRQALVESSRGREDPPQPKP